MKNTRLQLMIFGILGLLSIPLIAMQVTTEVNWSAGDFLIMGTLLLTVILLIEFVLQKITDTKSRIGIVALVLVLFLLIWAELAVGIFNSPFAGS
ncbi:hypothetical protein EQG63_06920 [Flavobacterium amnicola]|uniref:Uncharacterized protein n=1 Tax=Flavobacterium amnicola TaxID=2506422 RepID=A0A4Q1K2A9_9FLAO|nr:hypothetical protein [Flavobacterium amnicola]RXR19173.1 hypothetical protein EQG63_06920 [Flavobacterium amnicola]